MTAPTPAERLSEAADSILDVVHLRNSLDACAAALLPFLDDELSDNAGTVRVQRRFKAALRAMDFSSFSVRAYLMQHNRMLIGEKLLVEVLVKKSKELENIKFPKNSSELSTALNTLEQSLRDLNRTLEQLESSIAEVLA